MQKSVDLELDLSGLSCPLPLLKAKQALNKLASGSILKVIATDPGSERDFKVFAEMSKNKLIDFSKDSEEYYYWLMKK